MRLFKKKKKATKVFDKEGREVNYLKCMVCGAKSGVTLYKHSKEKYVCLNHVNSIMNRGI